jgi:hypothetical protein
MTLSIMTLSIMTLSIMKLSIVTLSIMTLSIMTLSIMKLSIMTLSIMTIVIKIIRHYAEGRIFTVILNIIGCLFLPQGLHFFIVMLSVSLCMLTACLLLF